MSLQDQRDFFLRSLDDLEAERAAGDISEADYLALRDEYTVRAADLLRSGGDVVSTRDRETRPGRRVFVVGAVIAVAVLAGVLAARGSGQRLPGDPGAGTIEAGPTQRVDQARVLVSQGNTQEALRLYQSVLDEDPRHPAALADLGWLLRQSGRPDDALAYLDRAVAADPTYPDAHFFRGMVLWKDKADPAGGAAEFKLALANNPRQDLRRTLEGFLPQVEAEANR